MTATLRQLRRELEEKRRHAERYAKDVTRLEQAIANHNRVKGQVAYWETCKQQIQSAREAKQRRRETNEQRQKQEAEDKLKKERNDLHQLVYAFEDDIDSPLFYRNVTKDSVQTFIHKWDRKVSYQQLSCFDNYALYFGAYLGLIDFVLLFMQLKGIHRIPYHAMDVAHGFGQREFLKRAEDLGHRCSLMDKVTNNEPGWAWKLQNRHVFYTEALPSLDWMDHWEHEYRVRHYPLQVYVGNNQ